MSLPVSEVFGDRYKDFFAFNVLPVRISIDIINEKRAGAGGDLLLQCGGRAVPSGDHPSDLREDRLDHAKGHGHLLLPPGLQLAFDFTWFSTRLDMFRPRFAGPKACYVR